MWLKIQVGRGSDMQAMSEAQIANQIAAQAHMMRNTIDLGAYGLLMANYRPPVTVPEGWAEWFAHGEAVT